MIEETKKFNIDILGISKTIKAGVRNKVNKREENSILRHPELA